MASQDRIADAARDDLSPASAGAIAQAAAGAAHNARSRSVVGAAMVGMAALLQLHADPKAHWSDPHQPVQIVTVAGTSSAGLDLDLSPIPERAPAHQEPRPQDAPQL